MARIGLFGGSFDPPHLAHLALARSACQALQLNELRWLVAGAPWQKAEREQAAPHHRLAMVRALMQGEPGMVVDERELHRAGPTYTADSVAELASELPGAQLFLVIGQDQYARFHTWVRHGEILQRCTLAVAARQGQAVAAPPELAAVQHLCTPIPLPAMAVSSTQLRALAARGDDLTALAGPVVAGYIARHHLYIKPDGHS